MNLKCMINGKISGIYLPNYNGDNNLIQGNTITDEYSETLDSGSIILTDVPKIKNLDPYDDVFVWDADFLPNFNGITKTIDSNGCVINHFEIFTDSNNNKKFYKHFLVDRYTEERNLLNQDNYTYKIELFSETKGLETVILPNIKITQPLDFSKKTSTFYYMQQYLEMYSPKIKIKNGNSWRYEQKYKLSPEMYDLFKNHYCQEFLLNSPTLRELFTKLMVSKDCIPVVRDNVIYPLMLSKTIGQFNISNDEKSFIISNKTSDGYVTQFRTNYNNALATETLCHRVEHLGFRNSDEAILTINNMRLETGFPIYKLNKVYACYYKRFIPSYEDPTTGELTPDNRDYFFLCKQDITDFCVLNNERQALYKDSRINSDTGLTIDQMKECYYLTLGYSIGSNLITGFGETFTYIEHAGFTTWNNEECIIRNLLNRLDDTYSSGVDGENWLRKKFIEKYPNKEEPLFMGTKSFKGYDITESPSESDGVPSIFLDFDAGDNMPGIKGDSILIKGITFEVDYEGFYNGAIYTNKEVYKKPIVKVDNQSDSLPILEIDGISKERKIEKMGNKTYTINARYENWDNVQEVGTIFRIGGSEENQDDYEEIIIYHRDISLYDNCINVTYFGQESFVLKNFYTSVFAKQRLYNVLDYGNSITRAENIKDIILFSKTKQYVINPNFSSGNLKLETYLSSFKNPENRTITPTNTATLMFYDSQNDNSKKKYFADVNVFTSGNSVCFNTTMFDNITMGEQIDKDHLAGKMWGGASGNNYAGTSLLLCTIFNDRKTGRSNYINFTFSSKTDDDPYKYILEDEISANNFDVKDWQEEKLYLPYFIQQNDPPSYYSSEGQELFSKEKKVYKDANEIINMTFQTQLIVDKKDKSSIFLSDKILKLSDFIKPYRKGNSSVIVGQTGTITLMPFQFISVFNPNLAYAKNKASLQGFVIRVSNILLKTLVQNTGKIKLYPKMYLSIEGRSSKEDTLIWAGADRILDWTANFNGSQPLYFVPTGNDASPISAIRMPYNSMTTQLYDISASQNLSNSRRLSTGEGYIYLEKISSGYIKEALGVDKSKFTYFSNIRFDLSKPGSKNLYTPILNNYFVNNDLGTGIENSKMPDDSTRYNNLFWGYIYQNNGRYVGDPTEIPDGYASMEAYGDAKGFESLGSPVSSYICNYYKNEVDYLSIDNSTKNMPTYEFQTYNEDIGQYGYPTIDAFSSLETDTNNNYGYREWRIAIIDDEEEEIENMPDNTIICVGGPEIEASLIDEKVIAFSSLDGYDILKNNNVMYKNYEIFTLSTNFLDNPERKGKLLIDLDKIPKHYIDDNDHSKGYTFNYQSIQEWVFNARNNTYDFVCGFNITNEDVKNYNDYLKHQENPNYEKEGSRYIIIYLSLVGDLDLEVYDDNGILKGYVGNKAKGQNDVVDLT